MQNLYQLPVGHEHLHTNEGGEAVVDSGGAAVMLAAVYSFVNLFISRQY